MYPREVVRRGLLHNAASVIFAHNHPGGSAEPSRADLALTCLLRDALNLVDIRTHDHFIVAGANAVSLAVRDLMGKFDFPELQESQKKTKQTRKATE